MKMGNMVSISHLSPCLQCEFEPTGISCDTMALEVGSESAGGRVGIFITGESRSAPKFDEIDRTHLKSL
jgi:hypothetical protein